MIWWLFFSLWVLPLMIILAMTGYAFDGIEMTTLLMTLGVSNAWVWLLIALFQSQPTSAFFTKIQWFFHQGGLVLFLFVTLAIAILYLVWQPLLALLIISTSLTLLATLIARPDKHDIYRGKKLMMPKDRVFWILLFTALFVWMSLTMMTRYWRILLVSFVLLLIYRIIISSMKLLQGKSFFSLWSSKVVLFVFLLSLFATFFMTYRSIQDTLIAEWTWQFRIFAWDKIKTDLWLQEVSFSSDRVPFDDDSTLNTPLEETIETVQSTTWDILTGNTSTVEWERERENESETDVTILSWTTIQPEIIEVKETTETTESTITQSIQPIVSDVTFADALTYLFEQNNISLVRNSTVVFDSITRTNTNYNLFATAYNLKLIGKNIKPGNLTPCTNYQVFKWIIQWWKVWQWDILNAYRSEAQKRGVINGCVKWETVTTKTL